MINMLRTLSKNLNRIEVRGQENLALLYNSIDVVDKLIEALPEKITEEVNITNQEEETSNGHNSVE